MKSRGEIEELKRQWRADPNWDIETTEGFEAHEDELRAYSEGLRATIQTARATNIARIALDLQCSVSLARAVLSIHERLDRLER